MSRTTICFEKITNEKAALGHFKLLQSFGLDFLWMESCLLLLFFFWRDFQCVGLTEIQFE